MKQQIEIDVPDGYEILNDGVHSPRIEHFRINPIPGLQVKIYLKKKEPEEPKYIEVREFVGKTSMGEFYLGVLTKGRSPTPDEVEKHYDSLVKWIDQDYRKVYV